MVSIVLPSWNEPKTIGDCIKSLADPNYSGYTDEIQLIQISPDDATLEAGKRAAKELNLGDSYIAIRDPRRGKPAALKLAFKEAKGDIIVITDGDTKSEKDALKYLLEPFKDPKIGASTGRPVSYYDKSTFWGYIGNLLPDSADHRRRKLMNIKNGNYYVSDKYFFPVSGYLMAYRNVLKEIPHDVLSDDGYISYAIRNEGYEIAYCPLAIVTVKFPRNLSDYLKQKVRSLGGYIQLERFGVMKRDKQSRSFLIELTYAFWVLAYPKSFKEFIYSICFFPIRLYTWIKILIVRVILKKGMPKKGWERIESTK